MTTTRARHTELPDAATALLSLRDLSVGYRVDGHLRTVLHGVSMDLERGETLALVGESGSGKSTTGHAILGLLPDNAAVLGGSVLFDDLDLARLPQRQWSDIRGSSVALIPQDPGVSLDPVRRVGRQVEDVLRLHTDLDAAGRRARVIELFELVGFTDPERRYAQYPHELSGGMRQRVLIAAAVAGDPDLIIADEPTSGLDVTVQQQVLDLIDSLRTRLGTAVVLITHDLGIAADRSDLVAVMRGGDIVEAGPTAEILARPGHPYTRQLLDNIPSRRGLRVRETPVDSAAAPVIEVTGLHKAFNDVTAVADSNFTVHPGETLAVVGESGSGKSTTARILTGLETADSGSVRLLGNAVDSLGRRRFRPLRRNAQIVHQNPFASFDPRFDVFDVVVEPLLSFDRSPSPFTRWSRRARHRAFASRVTAALKAAALPPDFAYRHPRELSGGQQQRVAIARALILEPKVLVLDEPISALDVSVAAQILDLLDRLQRERNLAYVFISHDLGAVAAIADRVIVMEKGHIVEQGPVNDVFTAPDHPYTRRLLGAIAGQRLTAGTGPDLTTAERTTP